jgi:hypothetical protein
MGIEWMFEWMIREEIPDFEGMIPVSPLEGFSPHMAGNW